MKPIYALADSRLLFWRGEDGSRFLEEILSHAGNTNPRVAYLGASNYDRIEYYRDIFEPALADIPCDRRMIPSRPSAEDEHFLENADVIVLAGGSVEAGWRVFSQNGYRELIVKRFHEGATLAGVSAGAVQLGKGGLTDDGSSLVSTFAFIPFYIGAHEENQHWESLRRVLRMSESSAVGIGIPSGGGVVYRNNELESIGRPVHRIVRDD